MTLSLDPLASRRVPARILQLLLAAPLVLGFAQAPLKAATPADEALYKSIVSDPSRSDEDRKMDETRKPLEFLEFTGVEPGMRVLDLSAGAGYTSELLAHAVGPGGHVFAQVEEAKAPIKARLGAMTNVTIAERAPGDPVPLGARPLDLITIVLAYHDITYMAVDRKEMNRYLFDALKPGGMLVVIDHSARPGSGAADGKTLHRVDQGLVKKELTEAGFLLVGESNAWRNPDDPRDHAFFDTKIATDRFAMRFMKPLDSPS
jgi:predicted methyltransferase